VIQASVLGCLAGCNIDRFEAFSALSGGILHYLPFAESLESRTGNVGMMDEQILSSIIGNDESETLLIVEPFDFAFCHR
jgi:hypothetical protein